MVKYKKLLICLHAIKYSLTIAVRYFADCDSMQI